MVWLALLFAIQEPHFSARCEALHPLRVVNNEIVPPVVVHRVAPKVVPSNAIVIIGTIIDKAGNVCDAQVLKGAGRAADVAAVDAVRQWTFRPLRFHGETYACLFTVAVRSRTPARGR